MKNLIHALVLLAALLPAIVLAESTTIKVETNQMFYGMQNFDSGWLLCISYSASLPPIMPKEIAAYPVEIPAGYDCTIKQNVKRVVTLKDAIKVLQTIAKGDNQ